MLEANLLSGKMAYSGKGYRYYRLMINTFNQPGAAIAISELELYDKNGANVSVPRGSTAKAGGQYGSYSPIFAFNGHWADYPSDCWQFNGASPMWISIDLGQAIELSKYAIRCPNGTPNFSTYSCRYWELQGSNDNAIWEPVHNVINYTVAVWAAKEYHEWVI